MATPFCGLIEEICVMLAHHGMKFVTKMAELLESNEYKVTTIDRVQVAMSILSKGKEKVDVMIINIHSPDSLCFELLKQAFALDIVTLFVCDEHNELIAKKAFDNGTHLYLEKSLDETIVKNLWQFVLRKKIQTEKTREGRSKRDHVKYVDTIGNENIVGNIEQSGEKSMSIHNEEQSNNIHETENNVVSRRTNNLRSKRCKKGKKVIDKGERQSIAIYKTLNQKDCIEWTVDLRAKFKEATQQIGEGRCLPKEILEIMNVPGLTRMQVASYLQRCRINKRRPSKEKEYIRHRSSSGSQQRIERSSHRIFGRIPDLQTNVPNQTHGDPEFPPVNTNNIYASSTEQQLYHPQLQVQQHYLSSFLSGQNNDGSRQQQQHGLLFGSQGPIIGSSNSNFYMRFNNGDHHDFNLNCQTQNDYNLDLNQPYVTTNSTSAIMTDMNAGNAITNGSGEANTNFEQYIGEENIFVPRNFIATSNTSANEGSDLNEWENCDAYLNFHNMDYLYHNIGVSSSILPNENGNEYDQVYSID